MSQFRSGLSDCPRGIDAGAYVLKALPADEREDYGVHLASCAHCTHEVDDLRRVVDTLPIAAPQATPPTVLKSRIMSVVNAEAQLLRAAGPEADRVTAPKRRRFALPALSRTLLLRPAFAGALACTLLGIGLLGGVVVETKATPDTKVLRAQVVGNAQAHLLQTGDRASLELTHMPSLSAGQVYQVWLDKGDGPKPTHTLFNVRSDGRARVAIDESVKGVRQVLVTAEKSGGALKPSGAPLITAYPV